MTKIKGIRARELQNSRGNQTVAAKEILDTLIQYLDEDAPLVTVGCAVPMKLQIDRLEMQFSWWQEDANAYNEPFRTLIGET